MSVWTDSSPAALQAQLEKALFVIHFFAGIVFIHVLSTLRSVEWSVSRGRVACRWSLFNATCCRILSLVSISSLIVWLDYLELRQRRITAVFNLFRATQTLSAIFSIMIITLGVASIWNNRRVTYLVEAAFLGVAGISLATLCGPPSDQFAPVSPTLFPLIIARLIFCGALVVLALWGILSSRERNSTLKSPQNGMYRAKNLYETLQKDKFHYYCIAFLSQVAPLVVSAMVADPFGLLRMIVEYVSFAVLTLTGSLLFQHIASSSNRCPVTRYCIVVGLLLHITGWGQAMYGRLAANTLPQAEEDAIPLPASSRCPYSHRQSSTVREKADAAVNVFADAGIIHLQPKTDKRTTVTSSSQGESSTSESRADLV